MKKLLFIILFLSASAIIKAQTKNSSRPPTHEITVDEPIDGYPWHIIPTINDTTVFMGIDIEPQFPGGSKKFYQYLADNLKKNGDKGRVIVSFIVEKDGSLSHIMVVRHVSDSADKEALRIMSSCSRWIPGKQDNIVVRTGYVLAINFD